MSNRFHKLKNNDSDFPIVDNVNVYKYDNDFDYSRYNTSQMDITICNVPWDMGEAHIGNRVISGIGNVVHFGTKAKRDKYFSSISDSKCLRFTTKYKELHRDEYIDVPIPFDVCARYNYVAVHYDLFANNDSTVEYETENGVKDWFYFIREVEFLAPNTTRLHILDDAFQTFIYDLDVSGMILERGHAPMFSVDIDDYLENPVSNCSELLSPDINFGDVPNISKKSSELIFNSTNIVAVIVSTANPYTGNWGSKSSNDWNTPGNFHFQTQGAPQYCAFAMSTSDLSMFLINVDSQAPQFMQTIKAVCFVSTDFVYLGTSFSFCGIACNIVGSNYVASELYTIDKDDFGYSDHYEDIAKLYTYPYARLLINDENGESTEIRIEDCSGTLTFKSRISLVYPWLNLSGQLTGIGKAANKNISFKNVNSHSMPIGGNWYDHLYSWDIPTFAVVQDASINNDFATHFDRLQQATAATNQYNSELASANAALANANETASTALANANETANTLVANANLQVALNNANTATSNVKMNASRDISNAQSSGNTAAASALTRASTNNDIDKQYATGTTAAVSAGINGAVNGGVTALTGGPHAAAVGAIIGGAVGAIGAHVTMQAGINYTEAQNDASQNQMRRTNLVAQTATSDEAAATITENNSRNTAANAYTTGVASNQAALINDNAARDYSATTDNAARDYSAAAGNAARSLDTANNAISNQIKQAALNTPYEFGNSNCSS